MIGTILRLLRNVAATSLRSTGKQQPDVAEQSREPEHAIRRLEMEAVLARARLRQVDYEVLGLQVAFATGFGISFSTW